MDDYYICDDIEAMSRMSDIVINIQDAIIEEIIYDNRVSYVTISYGVLNDFNMINMTLVRLVVDENTTIRSRQGRNITAMDLRVGNVVDASFSAVMTRSIPPQSRAYMITVVQGQLNPNPDQCFSNIVEDRIMEIDINNNFIYTGVQDDIFSQIRFVVSNKTDIFDRIGNRIRLRDLRPGKMIRVEHADFMTASIPPQTTAFRIWVL